MNSYLIYLEWPEKCFRVDAEALRFFRSLVPAGSEVVRVRSDSALLRALPRATHVVTWHFKSEWFARAPRLKLLATPAAGRELVPKEGPEGVKIHFGGFHGAIISETVIGFATAWAHGFFRKGPLWPRSNLAEYCREVAGTHAVIAGYGRVGRAIGARFEAMGARVSGFTRKNLKDLPAAAATADWFVLALPGDTGTDDFLDARLLRRLPRRAVVINVGRGNAVDEAALAAALESGRIAGAYLDVFKNEATVLKGIATKREKVDLANLSAAKAPRNLVRMPHSSAFSPRYVRMCFQELKDEGLLGDVRHEA